MSRKLILTLPEELSDLEAAAVELYKEAPRNSKSRKVLDLIVGGMILRDMGLLEYVVGLRSAREMICEEEEGQEKALRKEIFKSLSVAPMNPVSRDSASKTAEVPQTGGSQVAPVTQEPGVEQSEEVSAVIENGVSVSESAKPAVPQETQVNTPKEAGFSKQRVGFGKPPAGLSGMMQIQTGSKQ